MKTPPQDAEVLPPKDAPPSDPAKPSIWGQFGRWALGAAADALKGAAERSRVEVRVQRCPRCGETIFTGQLHERGAAPGSAPLLNVAPHVCPDRRPAKPPKAPKTKGGKR
jgi:hypothetical protein